MHHQPNDEQEPFEKLRHSQHRGNPFFENTAAGKRVKKGSRQAGKRKRGRARPRP